MPQLRTLVLGCCLALAAGCVANAADDTVAERPTAQTPVPPIPFSDSAAALTLASDEQNFVERDVSFRYVARCEERPHTGAYKMLSGLARSVGLTPSQRTWAYRALPHALLSVVH